VAALLTMGVSTVAIGLVPGYDTIGIAAPALLALCRFGQGIGLGGEWGGAILLATENAPPGKRAWYGMFPQLGAPIGVFFSGAAFLVISRLLANEQFLDWAGRFRSLGRAVAVEGIRTCAHLAETPVFQALATTNGCAFRSSWWRPPWALASAPSSASRSTWLLPDHSVHVVVGTTARLFARAVSVIQLFGTLFFAAAVPVGPMASVDGPTAVQVNAGMASRSDGAAHHSGTPGTIVRALGFLFMVWPTNDGANLAELFQRGGYTGSSLAYNWPVSGASLAPTAAWWPRWARRGFYLVSATCFRW
jgi:MFS family permease